MSRILCAAVLLALTGCANQWGWKKNGQFISEKAPNPDYDACVHEGELAAAQSGKAGNTSYTLMDSCMKLRGWTRSNGGN